MLCFTNRTLTNRYFWLLLILLFSAVCALSPFALAGGKSSGATVVLPQTESSFSREIPLKANDLVFSTSTHKVYASVPSAFGVGGNSITALDPATGTIDAPVFIGSEPTKLTLADDGQSLWASLEGSARTGRKSGALGQQRTCV